MELQAQIVVHGKPVIPDGLEIGPAPVIMSTLAELGVVPLSELVRRRTLLEQRCIEVEVWHRAEMPDIDIVDGETVGNPDDIEELCPRWETDHSKPEIWVSPEDFMETGVFCVAHRHILVTPCIPVWDLPPLDEVSSNV